MAFFLYLNRFLQPIQLLVQQYNTYQQGQASVFKLRTPARDRAVGAGVADATELPPIDGEIVFDDVTFGYDPAVPVLSGREPAHRGRRDRGVRRSDRSREVDDGQADRPLLRPDGRAGSSSTATTFATVTLPSLRRQLGVVPQEPFLFAGTIRDNIAFARPDAPAPRRWTRRSALSGCVELIDDLPDGLDTVVQERGQSLSSGERQLLALARAFLAHPRVLVLDEATSNLDLQSETKIEAALDVLLEARTAVLIAHRLSTAMKADRIVVVDDGRIAEEGSHDELVAAGGRYAEMYATWVSQSSGEEEASEERVGLD